jgi:hypothetical protein
MEAVADRLDLTGRSDQFIFQVACTEERAVITYNVKDLSRLATQRLAQGGAHSGLILLPTSRTCARPSRYWPTASPN